MNDIDNMDWKNPQTWNILRLIAYTNKICRSYVEERLKKAGFDDFQIRNMWLLKLVEHYPHQTLNKLANLANQSRTNITILSKRLTEKGYLDRYHPEDNKKVIYLKPTAKWQKIQPIIMRLMNELSLYIEQVITKERKLLLEQDLATLILSLNSLAREK
ncbi:hypothetical protein P344_04020 [Spiroplasma mirum ATCC 29335]|uniref:HTH marR-type domain-containing protein n=1 Tax=Spiroplasma mirum ATCC 29335 TaxID=838561 RepID=W0GRC2_9MOLU|nr:MULTISPECIES: MarR family transcriptional regulator [Spiroplasma]AHF61091.1 MarR family transcriptional regulator [Spiroplasma mirum ATCC 29335]AHI58132.1 hypothetical protein P344_04020 [Spiroplasma mirum ATCC 29335]AKM53186.1 MarR family transcriptional regulator [Spiroplasma atrichopogonis]